MSFKSLRLARLRETIKDDVNSKIKELNEVSADIAELEKELKKMHCMHPFTFMYIYKTEFDEDERIKEYALVWGKDRYRNPRIMYTIFGKSDPSNEVSDKIIFTHPLIECKGDIRFSVKDHLEVFFEGYIEVYKSNPEKLSVIKHRYDDLLE